MIAVRPMTSERSDDAEGPPDTGRGGWRTRPAVGRRAMLLYAGRAAAAAVLAAVVVLTRRGRAPAGETCTGGGICRTCDRLDRCRLPQGLSLKTAIRSRPS